MEKISAACSIILSGKVTDTMTKPDGPHYSRWGPSDTIGVCHIQDMALLMALFGNIWHYFQVSVPIMKEKTENNGDMEFIMEI